MIDVEKAKKVYRKEVPDSVLVEYGEIEGMGLLFVEAIPRIDDTVILVNDKYEIKKLLVTPTNNVKLPAYKKIANCFDNEEEKKMRRIIKDYDAKHGDGMFFKEVVNTSEEKFISSLKA